MNKLHVRQLCLATLFFHGRLVVAEASLDGCPRMVKEEEQLLWRFFLSPAGLIRERQ